MAVFLADVSEDTQRTWNCVKSTWNYDKSTANSILNRKKLTSL